ncbi:MAG TPA: VOC family protein [Blastocatellia bacterium]|nr:VOC family protein [Blastocatellia bacterium]
MEIIEVDHIHITVPEAALDSAKRFYGSVLGLEEIARPASTSGRAGAWYRLGQVEIHLSVEDAATSNLKSKRHICYIVGDIEKAEAEFRDAGVEILTDDRPIEGRKRFFVRDPGGNRLEIAQIAL